MGNLKNGPNKIRIKRHLNKQFKEHTGYPLRWKDPQTFNEKIQWLKLHYRDPLITKCSDKHAVRDYVEETIGKKYLIDLVGAWDKVADIDFSALPKKFVLKANNGSGTNLICHDKSKLDLSEIKEKLENWLKPEASHYFFSFEWGYKDVKPKIICEKLIENRTGLTDYKFFCFNGKPRLLSVGSDRQSGLKLDFFDLDWNRLPFSRHFQNSPKLPKQPKHFDEMIRLARKLSAPFPFVRVDFYEAKGGVMFGELTFYPGAGLTAFDPVEADYQLGNLLDLPARNVPSLVNPLSYLAAFKKFSYSD